MADYLQPFSAYSGPRQSRLLIVGEAFGEGEAKLAKPFVGESGKELWRMLGEAMPDLAPEAHARASAMHRYDLAWVAHRDEWLHAAGIAMTNAINARPPGNKIEALCGSKAEVGGKAYELPPLRMGKYFRPEILPHFSRLEAEIAEAKPNLILALGNTACWALLRATNIGSIRGTTAHAHFAPFKVLPSYHPAAVLRQWNWRIIVVADLIKASREMLFPEIVRPQRQVIINPTLAELEHWTLATLHNPPPLLGADIETGAGQIKCISFARSRSEAICVPFVDLGHPSGSYWSTPDEELQAWHWVQMLLESGIPKVGQNFLYDLQYITRMGIAPRACLEDTMLLHHSLFPEMQKGLGFLGSVYTDESSWKMLRKHKTDTEKRDE